MDTISSRQAKKHQQDIFSLAPGKDLVHVNFMRANSGPLKRKESMNEETSQLGNQQQNQRSRHGTVNNMTALHHSITARTRTGNLVEIVALGDVEGFSPACWVINGQGEIDLAPTNRFTVVDSNALPPSSQTFQSAQQGALTSSKY